MNKHLRVLDPNEILTHGGLTRSDIKRGGIPATPKQAAQMELMRSRDAEHDAAIWTDNGRTIAQLAHTAGVKVTFAHVDLTAQTTEYRTVNERSAPND